jgi:hypothetical protein
MLPGGILFLLPFIPLSIPISSTISPQMKINIKMIRDDALQLRDSKSNLFGRNREPKEPISNERDMETSRSTSNEDSVSRKVKRRKTASR